MGVNSNRDFYKWTPSHRDWAQEDILGKDIIHASIGRDGTTFVIDTNHHIFRKVSEGNWV